MSTSAYGHGLPGVPPTLLTGRGQMVFRPDRDLLARRAAAEKLAQRCPDENPDPMKALMSGQYRIPDEVTSDLGMNAVQQYNVNQRLYEISQSGGGAVRMRQDLAALAREADLADDARRFLQTRGIAYCIGQTATKSLVLRKASGEGSRGGKIIGHYASGTPIYEAKTRWSKAPGGHSQADHEAAQQAHEDHHASDIYGNAEPRRGATLEAVYHHAAATGKYEKPIARTRSGEMIYHPYSQKYAALHQSGSDTARIHALGGRLQYSAQDHADAADEHRNMADRARRTKDHALAMHLNQTSQAHALARQKGAVKSMAPMLRKANTSAHGLPITVERRAGKLHHWQARDGSSGTRRQLFDYGFIDGTVGADGEEYDVYLGPNKNAKTVYIAHQNRAGSGKYDEDKAMVGFNSEGEARAAYLASYGGKESMLRNITSMPVDAFKRMVRKMKKSKTDGRGDEKDSAASIRGAEIARQLKEKIDQDKGNKVNKSMLLIKSSGAGSRGGRVIGHTKSGKPIYAGNSPSDYKGFSREDHYNASQAHEKEATDHKDSAVRGHEAGPGAEGKSHSEMAKEHQRKSNQHFNASQGASDDGLRSGPRVSYKDKQAKTKSDKQARAKRNSAHKSLQGNTVNLQDLSNSELVSLIKSGSGAGSRGGNVIGHTRSGKPIYDAKGASYGGAMKAPQETRQHHVQQAHPDFSSKDHSDAAQAHMDHARGLEKQNRNANPSIHMARAHADAARNMGTKHKSLQGNTMNKAETVDVGGDPLAFLGIKNVDLSENAGNGGTYATGNPGPPDTSNSNATVGDAPAAPIRALSADDVTNAYMQGSGGVGSAITPVGTYAAPPSTEYINNEVPLVDPLNIPTVVLSSEAKDDQGAMASTLNQGNQVMKSHFWADGGDFQVAEADMWSQADLVSKGATTIASEVLCKSCSAPRSAMINSCSNCGEGAVFGKSFLDNFAAHCGGPGAEPTTNFVDASQGLRLYDEE